MYHGRDRVELNGRDASCRTAVGHLKMAAMAWRAAAVALAALVALVTATGVTVGAPERELER